MCASIWLTDKAGTMKNKPNQIFTTGDLKAFNGESGNPTYVVYEGIVYDVSDSTLWTNGKHHGRHLAGDDSTEGMINAPHGDEVLAKFPIVGELGEERLLKEKLVRQIEKVHLHSVLVHFSIAYSILIPVLVFLYLITGETSIEKASYYVLIAAFLSTPIGGLSGIFSWRVTYEGRLTKTFIRKIFLTIAVTSIVTACFVWRTMDPNLLIARTGVSYLYVILITVLVPLVTILGHYGGKLVYP